MSYGGTITERIVRNVFVKSTGGTIKMNETLQHNAKHDT